MQPAPAVLSEHQISALLVTIARLLFFGPWQAGLSSFRNSKCHSDCSIVWPCLDLAEHPVACHVYYSTGLSHTTNQHLRDSWPDMFQYPCRHYPMVEEPERQVICFCNHLRDWV